MVELNAKYGCLTVLDMGEEYPYFYESECDELAAKIQIYESIAVNGADAEKIDILESSSEGLRFVQAMRGDSSRVDWMFDVFVGIRRSRLQKMLDEKQSLPVRYKCQCKCGKIHYYTARTIESKPRFCRYPIAISTRHTYSVKAQNATYRKRQKYGDIECVVLCDKADCVPSSSYCDLYNKDREKKLASEVKKSEDRLASYPSHYDANYNGSDLTGKIHETLEVLGPANDEVILHEYRRKRRLTGYYEIFKRYRCRCQLCGEEYLFRSGDFSVNPPDAYGPRAYGGYWSAAHCNCHPISSFQWTVVGFLEENNFRYVAEAGFPELIGVGGGYLRFDFILLDAWNWVYCIIECQGDQHYVPVDEFGGESKFQVQQANDELKREFARKYKIPFIELSHACGKTVSDRLQFLSDTLARALGNSGLDSVKLHV